MKAKSILPRLGALALVIAVTAITTSCHFHGHFNDTGMPASDHKYVHRGHEFTHGTGPWYREGVYKGPVEYYYVDGQRFVLGCGPWFHNGRYINANYDPVVTDAIRSIQKDERPSKNITGSAHYNKR